jgi:hypothetical protein
MRTETRHTRWAGVVSIGMGTALLLGACGSANGTGAHAGATVTLRDSDNGTSVDIHSGDIVKVVLASTYWTVRDSSNSAVLRTDGPADVVPRRSGCVPGQGCGTVTATFTAVGVGSAVIVATREVCGEALQCRGANGHYQVTVKVS